MAEECVYKITIKDDGEVFFTALVRDPEDRPIVKFIPEATNKIERILSSCGSATEFTDVDVSLDVADESSTVYESLDAVLKAINTVVENKFTCDLDA
jgi:hypothetical protein